MCGTRTETVTVPAAVDDLGMPLTVPDEVTAGNNYRDCVTSDLQALCTYNQIDIFSSTGTTRVANCCARNVADGMGLNTVTNQCRLGDGCAPITTPGTTTLGTAGLMITCTCSGNDAMVQVLNIVATTGAGSGALTAVQTDNAEVYNTCLQTSLSALCTSTGFSTFMTMGTTAVATCCMTPDAGGSMGTPNAGNNDCVVTA